MYIHTCTLCAAKCNQPPRFTPILPSSVLLYLSFFIHCLRCLLLLVFPKIFPRYQFLFRIHLSSFLFYLLVLLSPLPFFFPCFLHIYFPILIPHFEKTPALFFSWTSLLRISPFSWLLDINAYTLSIVRVYTIDNE